MVSLTTVVVGRIWVTVYSEVSILLIPYVEMDGGNLVEVEHQLTTSATVAALGNLISHTRHNGLEYVPSKRVCTPRTRTAMVAENSSLSLIFTLCRFHVFSRTWEYGFSGAQH